MATAPVVMVSDVPVHACDLDGAATKVVQAALQGRQLSVHLCNAYVLALASRDPAYARLLARGDLNLADGAPLAWFVSRTGTVIKQRPSGAELVDAVARRDSQRRLRHYLYGSSHEVVTGMARTLEERHPGIVFVGVESPPFGPVTEASIDALAGAVRKAGANILWVGLGTPKQDEVVDRLRGRFDGVCVPIGAAFDFVAGKKSRAPRWMRRSGLEWVYRLLQEPGRLWRRYLWGNVRFLWALARTGRVVHGSDEPTA